MICVGHNVETSGERAARDHPRRFGRAVRAHDLYLKSTSHTVLES